jgi:hypothetical protein
MVLKLLLAAMLLGPSSQSLGNRPGSGTGGDQDAISRAIGFAAVLINQVNRAIGTENLPMARGTGVDPGMFVTLGMQGMQVFDHDVVPLQQGRNNDRTAAEECVSGCSALFFDTFQLEWLKLSIEGATLAVRVPERVHIAADANVPMSTFFDAAYAAAESRPVLPPTITILVNAAGRGVRALPVFLLPPQGLEMPQGAAALGFRIRFGSGGIVVDASDPTLGQERRLSDIKQLTAVMKALVKRHPNKDVVVLQPDESVTVGELVQMIEYVRGTFPRIVLSQGQELIL